MTPETISVITAVAGFFFTCLGNALILGLFLGGMKGDMGAVKERLARIEGMFTLVPRRDANEVANPVPVGMVRLDSLVSALGISPDNPTTGPIHTQ